MRHIIFSCVILYALCSWSPVRAEEKAVTVFINGHEVPALGVRLMNGNLFVPAFQAARVLKLNLRWDASSGGTWLNGRSVNLLPLTDNGRLMISVESLVRILGANMEFDGSRNVLNLRISSQGAAPPAAKQIPSATSISTANGRPPAMSTQEVKSVPSSPPPNAASASAGGSVLPSSTPGTHTGSPDNASRPMSSQPSDSAYPTTDTGPEYLLVRPLDAPPKMPPNLTLPPVGSLSVPGKGHETSKVMISEGTIADKYPTSERYTDRSAKNHVFSVTVTNIEMPEDFKGYWKAQEGHRFCVVYLSQRNISNDVQIYTGRFSLLDKKNQKYDYSEGMSNFWLMILKPGASNFGYLVFEIPVGAMPAVILLHALQSEPLTVNL